jgi:glycosyltransferase involved in cell wall biosynthesis
VGSAWHHAMAVSIEPGISAVLPAYNEEGVIEHTVRQVAEVVRSHTPTFEVIVANEGSRDGTGEILARQAHEQPDLCLRVVTDEHNLGYGAALASGFDALPTNSSFSRIVTSSLTCRRSHPFWRR